MKVRIIKAGLDTYWYADKIGEVFEVGIGHESDVTYSLINDICFLINNSDCEVIKEYLPKPKTNEKLRDKFAMAALAALISKAPYIERNPNAAKVTSELARGAYVYADAMLKAKEANE